MPDNLEQRPVPLPVGSPEMNRYLPAIPFFMLMVLQLLGWLWPGSYTWGFSFWNVVNPSVAVAVFAVGVLLLYPRFGDGIGSVITKKILQDTHLRSSIRPLAIVASSVVMVVVLYLLRSKALVYGDGYSVLTDASDTEGVVLFNQYYVQIVALYFHHYLIRFFTSWTTMTPEQIYALANAIGGMLGLWAIVRISGQITSSRASKLFVMIGALSSGSVILFLGYIENYTWATMLSLWAISYAVGYAERRNGALPLFLFALLAFLFHMIALPFLIVAVITLFLRSTPAGNLLFGIRLWIVNIAIAVVSMAMVAVSRMFDVNIFTPIFRIARNSYWFLSEAHIVDVLNEMVLVAGLGVMLLVFGAVCCRRRVFAVGPIDGILGTAALLTFLASFWIDPQIGAPRDWDLLSIYGFPLTIWALYRTTKYFAHREVPSRLVVAVLVAVVIQHGGNIFEKSHPDLAVTRLDGLLEKDIHYQPEYSLAHRCIAWAAILQDNVDRRDLAVKYLKRRLQASDKSYEACFNLAYIYYEQGKYDSAVSYLSRGLAIKPDDTQMLLTIARLEQKLGNFAQAAKWFSRALEFEPDNHEMLTELGVALGADNRATEALPYFQRANELAAPSFELLVNLAMCHVATGSSDSALYYMSRVLPTASTDTKIYLYPFAVRAALELGLKQKAQEYLSELRAVAPQSPDVIELTRLIQQADEQ